MIGLFLRQQERILCLSIAFILSLLGGLTAEGYQNNFKIFQGAYFHWIERLPLYKEYPKEYFDFLLYGPAFSCLVAPFCQLGFHIDKVLWVAFNTFIYLWAIDVLFQKRKGFYFFWLFICFQDIYISGLSFEITHSIIAVIIFAFLLLTQNRQVAAGSLVGFFTLIKLFPVMASLFFSPRSGIKYLFGFVLGLCVAFVLPSLFTDYQYVVDSYLHWIQALTQKDSLNAGLNPMIDYSLPGLFRKNLHNPNISTGIFVLFGFICLVILFIKNYRHGHLQYELLVLAILTCFVFNSSSESPTIIISSTAVAIWFNFLVKERTQNVYIFLALYLLCTSWPSIDGYPKWFKLEILHERGFRALMPVLLWFYIVFKSYRKNSLVLRHDKD